MKATLLNENTYQQTTMADMKLGDLAVILSKNVCPSYVGDIVWRLPNHADTYHVQSLTTPNRFWTTPNQNPVRILKPGESILLTQE